MALPGSPSTRALLVLGALLCVAGAWPTPARAEVLDPAPYDALLRAHVKDGRVDYAALGKDRAKLDAWLTAAAEPALAKTLGKASRAEKLAFWINVYNAATLQLILRHLPGIDSIRDIDAAWKKPKWTVAGESLSLDEMEHRKIREEIGEPRIHFALVCAARGCPDLRSRAWSARGLDGQLDEATRRFLAADKGARAVKEGGRPVLKLSHIFEWYAKDFGGDRAAVVDWVARHAPEDLAQFIGEHRDTLAVAWLPYDWSLNTKR